MCKYTKKADASKTENIGICGILFAAIFLSYTTGTTAATTRTIFAVLMDFSHSPYCIEHNPDKDYTSNKHLKLLSDWKLTTY